MKRIENLEFLFIDIEKRLDEKVKQLQLTQSELEIEELEQQLRESEIIEQPMEENRNDQKIKDMIEFEQIINTEFDLAELLNKKRIVINYEIPINPEKFYFMSESELKEFVIKRYPTKSMKFKEEKYRTYNQNGFRKQYSVKSQCNPKNAKTNYKPKVNCYSLNSKLVDKEKIWTNLQDYATTYVYDLEIRGYGDLSEYSCVLDGYIEMFLNEFIPNDKATKINGDNGISQIWEEALATSEKENCVF
ncbi:MAG: hypothetical protein ACTSP9_03160 [Promethearchaeota archaeon]